MIVKDMYAVKKSKIGINISKITFQAIFLGILLSIVGGFLDAYTYIGRDGVFANAQTGNVVLVGIEIFNGKWHGALMHILPIISFITGVIVSEIFNKNPSIYLIKNPRRFVLIIETIILFIIGFLPHTVPNWVVTVTISFVTSLQYCTFNKLIDYPYATTMCTGNLRSASQAVYAAYSKKDAEAAKKAIYYFTGIFSFLFGAFLGGFLTLAMGNQAVWFTTILLTISLIISTINS